LSLRPELAQQIQSPEHFPIRPLGVGLALLQQIGAEGTIEVAIAITTTSSTGIGISDHRFDNTSTRIDQLILRTPLLQKPGRIDFIAMGTCHHQHSGACHQVAALIHSLKDNALKRNRDVDSSADRSQCAKGLAVAVATPDDRAGASG
jgi:hypothetical protein